MKTQKSQKNTKYVFIGKTLFFPKEKILAVGDLHLGYEVALRTRGLDIPIRQFEEMLEELEQTLRYVKEEYGKIKHIIFLGDVKHHFGYLGIEKEAMLKLIAFLRKKGIEENGVIFIRGNHEKNDRSGKFVDWYIVKDIAFIHGHWEFPDIYAREVNLIVMGHVHPTVVILDDMKIKKEKYKCFLVGRYKKKDLVVLPSFISTTEGVSLNESIDSKGYDWSIIPNKDLENFEVFACGEIGEEKGALDFGKLKELGAINRL